MKTTVKKLFNNKISVRDYIVRDALKKHENLQVHYKDEVMVLTPRQLEEEGTSNGKKFFSKWGDGEYKLIDYKWAPDQKQTRMF